MNRFLLVAAVLGGCNFTLRAGPDDGPGEEVDAPPGGDDAMIDTPPPFDATLDGVDFLPDSEETFATGNWMINADVTIDTTMLTSTVPVPANVTLTMGVQDNGNQIAILRLRDLSITSGRTLRVVGTRPFVILSEHDVNIMGTLDIAARKGTPGAGGSLPTLGLGAGGAGRASGSYNDSGGGGASFGTAGSAGGAAGQSTGGTVGAQYAVSALVGGSGGGAAGVCANAPGAGGGALLLYARHKINLMGQIHAGGGGGGGGQTSCATGAGAGAGGGSGGLIWLQTPTLEGSGVLAANGGGGGGASYSGVSNGGDGGDAQASTTTAATSGTKANSNEATAGATGAVGSTPASTVGTLNAGNGGGGGGGLGRIVYRAPSLAMISSSPTAVTP